MHFRNRIYLLFIYCSYGPHGDQMKGFLLLGLLGVVKVFMLIKKWPSQMIYLNSTDNQKMPQMKVFTFSKRQKIYTNQSACRLKLKL